MYFQILRLIVEKLREILTFKSESLENTPAQLQTRSSNNVFNITVNVHNNVQGGKSVISGQGSMEDYIGTIKLFAGNYAPEGWLICDGRLLPISQYSALFSVVGTTYGGDGRTTFGIPDMRGRSVVGAGRGNGLTNRGIGEIFGSESASLNSKNLPIQVSDPVIPAAGVSNHSVTFMEPQPFEIIPPSISMNYIICWHGIYPQRPQSF